MQLSNRIARYNSLSAQLATQSDQDLQNLMQKTTTKHAGIGDAQSGILELNETTRLFFKTINLTDLEMRPENMHSTKNIFDLPLYYQYGIRLGTAGFGAWRELACQIMATNWVLDGACENFPILYHWRIMPRQVPAAPDAAIKLDEYVALWGGSPAIRTRFEAIQDAPACIVLFMEVIPYQIDTWLKSKFEDGTAQDAIAMIERDTKSITSFMKSQGLLHFDAHFGNILTDSKRLYLVDFGLAIFSGFDLSPAEIEFFQRHANYDLYEMETMIVLRMIDNLFPVKNPELIDQNRETIVREYATGKANRSIAPWATKILTLYAPVAFIMLEFWKKLRVESVKEKSEYPEKALELAKNMAK